MAKIMMTGNYASAYGARAVRAQVCAAYPITPQTTVVEKIAELVADGEFKTQYVKVESEHSAMAACIAASQVGARAYTATSAHGLALMHELLMWASGARTPVVMSNINRAMGPPWSVWADHHDSMAQRDTGWIQVYCESNQEVIDTIIQVYKVCEQPDIMLPAMVIEDAFILSHTFEPVDVPDMEMVDEFLPSFNPEFKLDTEKPCGFGSLVMPEQYMEFRYLIAKAMDDSRERLRQVDQDFEKKFGRSYHGLMEFYHCDDADVVLMLSSTTASTAKLVVNELRAEGKKVGVARLRVFRPFPVDEVRKLAEMVPVIGVMDRSFTFNYGGPMYNEVNNALTHSDAECTTKNYIAGLGGRDITPPIIKKMFNDLLNVKAEGVKREVEWVDLRGGDF
jgi:pyruvate/2-oxoacid:ferredoxin oxidoreductase alpha subunit